MTNYTIEPSKHGEEFEISIVNLDGSRQTILGFESIEAAEEWIAKDRELSAYDYKAVRNEKE